MPGEADGQPLRKKHVADDGIKNGTAKAPSHQAYVTTEEAESQQTLTPTQAARSTSTTSETSETPAKDPITDSATGSKGRVAGSSTRDIRHLFSGYFDTVNAGFKAEKKSYARIAEELGIDAHNILFLSDNVKGTLGYLSSISRRLHHYSKLHDG